FTILPRASIGKRLSSLYGPRSNAPSLSRPAWPRGHGLRRERPDAPAAPPRSAPNRQGAPAAAPSGAGTAAGRVGPPDRGTVRLPAPSRRGNAVPARDDQFHGHALARELALRTHDPDQQSP